MLTSRKRTWGLHDDIAPKLSVHEGEGCLIRGLTQQRGVWLVYGSG